LEECWPCPVLANYTLALTTEEKARKNLSQGSRRDSKYTHTRHPHITRPTHTNTQTHTLQNNLKPPQYKLKQTQYKIYPNEIITIKVATTCTEDGQKQNNKTSFTI
jgi:hypothetical protein